MHILNLEDSVIGSMHQVTIEEDSTQMTVRVDGNLLPPSHPFYKDVIRLYLSWSDHFEGITDKQYGQ